MKKLSKEAAELLLNISNNEELQNFAKELYPELGKKKLPKSWEELPEIDGWYFDNHCHIDNVISLAAKNTNKNVFATKEQAEAAIAMAQLSQLMKVYNDGWEADWSNNFCVKCNLLYVKNELVVRSDVDVKRFLTFKDKETAELFLENFTELINQAKPLL
jgi:hypothetical protein